MNHPLSGLSNSGKEVPWGRSPAIEDKIWMMEQGIMPRDEGLMNAFYAAKEMARRRFLSEHKRVLRDMKSS